MKEVEFDDDRQRSRLARIRSGLEGLHLAARVRPVVWLIPTLVVSIAAAYAIRFDGIPSGVFLSQLLSVAPIIVLTKTLAFLVMRLTLSCHAFVSLHDAFRLFKATFFATACVVAVDALVLTDLTVPRGVIVIDGCLTTLLVGGILTARRANRERREKSHCPPAGKRVLVVAGPSCGELLIRAIRQSRTEQLSILGILTDVQRLQHRAIGGITVLGKLEAIERLTKSLDVQMILLSSDDLPGDEVRRIMAIGESQRVEVRVVPNVSKIISGQIAFRPREVAIDDLLRRPIVDIDQSELKHWLSGKRLLVTGSCGSIGSELVRQLLTFNPAHMTLVDRSENGQFHLGRELAAEIDRGVVEIVIADATDRARLQGLFQAKNPQVVFHAAAYKHVPLMEQHPGEGIKNIVGATRNLADLSHASGVETFVMISTDKAVNPTSVMGCSKRVAELYVQSMSEHSRCRFVTVRFGNVLGSAGSVIPVFREQIAAGGPVTVTHPEMTRFFMTIPEASQLVVQAAAMGTGGEIFVLDMGTPVKILDLAEDMVKLSGLTVGRDIEIQITGLRPGEKLYEELYNEQESQTRTHHPKVLTANSVRTPHLIVANAVDGLLQISDRSGQEIRAALREIVPEYRYTPAKPKAFAESESAIDPDAVVLKQQTRERHVTPPVASRRRAA
jgi:FlaA1/EpsC-like NDP-sugar epimerase